jgi:hypothetical protein
MSQGKIDEGSKQLSFLLDQAHQGWIVTVPKLPSRASHAAFVVSAHKPNGTWRFCQDNCGLNAITQRSVEHLP